MIYNNVMLDISRNVSLRTGLGVLNVPSTVSPHFTWLTTKQRRIHGRIERLGYFDFVEFKFVNRDANRLTHRLAHWTISKFMIGDYLDVT